MCEVPEGTTIEKHIQSVAISLSKDTLNLIKFLAAITRKVVHNFEDTKMTFKNMAMLFTPTLFPDPFETKTTKEELELAMKNRLQNELKKQNFLEVLLQTISIV